MTRDIARALRIFAAERYALPVALPVALCLCLGPYAVAGGGWVVFVRVVVTTFLFLFVLRIVDDIASVDDDRLTHPTRALPSGRVTVLALTRGATVLAAATIVCSIGRLSLGVSVLGLYYVGYFLCTKLVPAVLAPWFANIVFFAIPIQMNLIQGKPLCLSLCVLGVFFWLSAVGHDYAHSVHAEGETHPGARSTSATFGSRKTAILGFTCYAAAFAMGALLARSLPARHLTPTLFLTGMTALLLLVSFLLVRLVVDPCAARAKPLYVSGFGFFLIPSVLLWLDRLLGI